MMATAISISSREEQVLAEIAKGCSNKQVSCNLGISINTTRTHIRSLMGRLRLANRVQLAMYYRDNFTKEVKTA